MIREAYSELVRRRIAKKDFKWVLKLTLRYLLIHASFLARRPLCGPILGTLVVDYKCNYRCKMCNMPQKEQELKRRGCVELTTLELKRLIKGFSDLGIAGLGFTGGEPLLRSDIFELLSYSKGLGLITHLNTNGYFLNEENARRLIDSGVDSVNISLDGASCVTHDSIRGYKGAFDKVISAARCINAARKERGSPVRLKVVTVVSKSNVDEIEDLLKLALVLQTDCIEFIPEQDFLNSLKQDLPDIDEDFLKKVNQKVEYLLKSKQKGMKIENSFRHLKLFDKAFRNIKSPVTCYAGYNSYAVDCYGQIYPCVPWASRGKSAGNLKEKPLKEFWYSKEYNMARRSIVKCKDCYLNCQTELNLLFNFG